MKTIKFDFRRSSFFFRFERAEQLVSCSSCAVPLLALKRGYAIDDPLLYLAVRVVSRGRCCKSYNRRFSGKFSL